jgi:hypothetical protein
MYAGRMCLLGTEQPEDDLLEGVLPSSLNLALMFMEHVKNREKFSNSKHKPYKVYQVATSLSHACLFQAYLTITQLKVLMHGLNQQPRHPLAEAHLSSGNMSHQLICNNHTTTYRRALLRSGAIETCQLSSHSPRCI